MSVFLLMSAAKIALTELVFLAAHLALIYEYPRRDPTGRKTLKLLEEAIVWISKANREIVREVGEK